MKDIQFLGTNNQHIEKEWIKGCAEACTNYCKGDKLLVASIRSEAIPTDITVVVNNPAKKAISFSAGVGLEEIGHLVYEKDYTLEDGECSKVFTEDITAVQLVADENIFITLTESMPEGSSICVIVGYLRPDIVDEDNVSAVPNLCGCSDTDVYCTGD